MKGRKDRKNVVSVILLIVIWLISGSALAEGGCPPGQVPQQFGPTMGCAPAGIGGALPPPKAIGWEDNWGAIATDGVSAYGVSEDKSSENDAIQAALDDCKLKGGTECVLNGTYSNGCIAIAAGDGGLAEIAFAETKRFAKKKAKSLCKGKKCRIYYSACSNPIPIYSR